MPERLAPAERVRRLRQRLGSHDKLAAALRQKGAEGATRQRVIGWEKGRGISERYALLLAALDDSNPEAFRPPRGAQQLQTLHRDVLQLAEDAKEIRAEVAAIRQAVEEAGIAVPESL